MDAHRLVVSGVVEQHVEEAVALANLRRLHVNAPHVNLQQLARLDERLEAHLDGVLAAGEEGWHCCEQALSVESAGSLFTASVVALSSHQEEGLDRVFALAEALPEAREGFQNALGWLSPEVLRDVASLLLSSSNPFLRHAGIAGCAVHGIDPGLILNNALQSPEDLLRAQAFRAAGQLGRRDLLDACITGTKDSDLVCRSWAAWAAVRLGDRGAAVEVLVDMYRAAKRPLAEAADLALLVVELPRAHALLSYIARDPQRVRALVRGAGLVGDAVYVPWLIERMDDESVARLAGEAFTLITGADLEILDLERDAPEVIYAEPNDDLEDNVEKDPDDGLPWPHPAKVAQWWSEHKRRIPDGVRTLMGAPLSSESCLEVLRHGYQRQRQLAALHRALQNPDAVIFECRAPASRQQRVLG